MTQLPSAALEQHIIVLGKTGAGKSSVMRLLVERLLDDGKPVCIIDPKGDWYGLKSSADGKRPGYPVVIFGGDHADVPLNPRAGAQVAELVATGNRPSLIDLGGWTVSDRTRFFVDFAQALFRTARGRRWLVIDEVHNFAPQGKVMDPEAGKMLHWANRLASEGRGKGIQLLVASQRPQKVHKDLVTSCETLVAMRVIHPLDRGAIEEWVDGCPDPVKGKEVLNSLASMPRGTGWAWSPEIGFGPARIAFPLFSTYDSFKAPTGEAVGKLKGWAEVDLDEVKAKLAAVVEQAKANDPAELKRQLAQARKDLAAAQTSKPVEKQEVKVERVEVPALKEADIKRLEKVAAVIEATAAGLATVAGGIAGTLASFRAQRAPAPAPVAAQRHVSPAPSVAGASIPRRSETSTGGLSKAERLVLTALAQYPDGRTKNQVAILSGYAVNGGGFNNAISACRSAGHLDGTGDRLRITDTGVDALGAFEPLPHGDALLQHWLRQLGKAEASALQIVVQAYPQAMSKEEVAEQAGYEPNGGGFNNALSRLRTLELIEGRGELRASEALFG